MRRAAELDPTSHQMKTSVAFVLSNARRYDEAIEIQKVAASMGQDSTLPQLDLARMYRLSGQYDLAVDLSRQDGGQRRSAGPDVSRCQLRARWPSRRSTRHRSHNGSRCRADRIRGFLLAIVYACLGDRDRAFQWLEVAYKQRDTFLPWLKVDPELDPLRGDPRFDDLVRRVGIPVQ